jgi:hypothetical protein
MQTATFLGASRAIVPRSARCTARPLSMMRAMRPLAARVCLTGSSMSGTPTPSTTTALGHSVFRRNFSKRAEFFNKIARKTAGGAMPSHPSRVDNTPQGHYKATIPLPGVPQASKSDVEKFGNIGGSYHRINKPVPLTPPDVS